MYVIICIHVSVYICIYMHPLTLLFLGLYFGGLFVGGLQFSGLCCMPNGCLGLLFQTLGFLFCGYVYVYM